MIKVGDEVTRYISSARIPMLLVVTEITETEIICGDWKFDRQTGAEIDEYLGWGPNGTGSFIKVIK